MIAFIVILSLVSFACDFSLLQSTPTMNETDIARAVEETLQAEGGPTLASIETELVQATDTPLPPPTTLPPTLPAATDAPIAPNTDTPPPPTEKPASSSPTEITEWQPLYWVPLSSGCTEADSLCWKLNDDFKTVGGPNTAYLTSEQEVFIEESWTNPALVYWNKRDLKDQAMLSLIVDGQLSNVQVISTGLVQLWRAESFDLSKYKGKTIRIQFSCPVGMRRVNSWFIHNIQIIPDYKD